MGFTYFTCLRLTNAVNSGVQGIDFSSYYGFNISEDLEYMFLSQKDLRAN